MIKIKISCKTESDVSTYIARDWTIKMFRGYSHGEFFVAEKDNIQFVVRETDDGRISLEKLVNGEPIDTKFAASDGCGIGGTLYINDHREPERCYAFFRNEKLQDLLDCFGIPKLIFQKTSVGSDHFVMGYETHSTEDEIITDGTIDIAPYPTTQRTLPPTPCLSRRPGAAGVWGGGGQAVPQCCPPAPGHQESANPEIPAAPGEEH